MAGGQDASSEVRWMILQLAVYSSNESHHGIALQPEPLQTLIQTLLFPSSPALPLSSFAILRPLEAVCCSPTENAEFAAFLFSPLVVMTTLDVLDPLEHCNGCPLNIIEHSTFHVN